MKLTKKILVIILCIFLMLPSYTNALSIKDTLTGAKDFLAAGDSDSSKLFNEQEQRKGVSELYYFGLGISIILAIIIGIVLGIQIITSGVEGKAKYKEKLIPYCVGCVVVFGALGIWRLAVKLVQDIF